MTTPQDLKVGHKVKMVRNDHSKAWPDKETPLGKVGKVVRIQTGRQPYLVIFENFKVPWGMTCNEWWCNRHELRKLPGRRTSK